MQKLATFEEKQDVLVLRSARRRQDILLFIVTFVTVLCVAPLLTLVGLNYSIGVTVGGIAALLVALAVVRWHTLGFFLVVVCVTLFEQDPLSANILTDRTNIYYWPQSLTGLPERPIGLLFLLILFSFLCYRFIKRKPVIYGGALLWPFLGFMACVVVGALYGASTGGDPKNIILEVRPFWYLFVAYLLAYNLVTQKSYLRAFFWIAIISAGIKGLQGCYIYFIVLHRSLEGQNEIMAHEESFFFVAMLLLIILFSMHYRYRPQLYTALAVTPFALVALAANNRRADYVALLVGVLVSWILIFLIKKQSRKRLAIGMAIFLVFGGAYVAVFARSSSSLAAPARSLVSVVNPSAADARDASSNLYRTIEDFDLKYTAKQSFPLGYGFGKEFLQPKILPNIRSEDPVYLLIPHNTIFWVWMRLGVAGFVFFWYLIGSTIVRGCAIVRQLRDPYLQLMAIYIVAIIFMEIVVAFADYQLYAFRNVLYLGLLMGVLLRLPALDNEAPAEQKSIRKRIRGVQYRYEQGGRFVRRSSSVQAWEIIENESDTQKRAKIKVKVGVLDGK